MAEFVHILFDPKRWVKTTQHF